MLTYIFIQANITTQLDLVFSLAHRSVSGSYTNCKSPVISKYCTI